MKTKGLYFRYLIIVVAVAAICVAILFKMARTVFVERDKWQAKAERPLYDTVSILAPRGNILATDGRLLATMMPRYTMYVDFGADGFNKDTFERYLDPLCQALAQMPGDRTAAEYKAHLLKGQRSRSRYYRISYTRLSYVQKKQILEYPFFNQQNPGKTGLVFEELMSRDRPFGLLASSTVGSVYINSEGRGASGIELRCDSLLRGVNGKRIKQRVQWQWVGDILTKPVSGQDVYTTIDVDIQDMAESALMNRLQELQADYGVAIIMEVKTGAIRAIANLDRQPDGSYKEGVNHAISDLLEPGSTFKTASMMVALDAGVVTPDEEFDTGNGLFQYGGRSLRDHNYSHGGYGVITAAQTIWYSSNVGISKIVLKGFEKDPKKYVDGLYAIGLNKRVDLGLPGAGYPIIKYPVNEDGKANPSWSKVSLPFMSFGYEVLIPPIYTLMFYNGIANGGKMIKPYIISGIGENGHVSRRFGTEVVTEKICKDQTLKEIRQMLVDVVQHGTAHGRTAVSSDYVQIAGKTGTAQIHQGAAGYKGNTVRYRVSFCGYFPAANPKYSGIVVVSNPRVGYPSGGTMPGAVLRTVADEMYARGFLPSKETMPRDTLYAKMPAIKSGDAKSILSVCQSLSLPLSSGAKNEYRNGWASVESKDYPIALKSLTPNTRTVPSVIGMGVRDAIYLLEQVGLRVAVEGSGKVVRQSIPVGRRFTRGEKITIVLK
ncbi:MAG: transpeptidase family protein [Porphyromonadaceae bacterium]|nr:transpeptidase family protein [Porphyromonadaceae bacterium]